MLLNEAKGPGVNDYLLDQLKSWGIVSLTEIQQKAISCGVADGKSMIVCAPTSSGKTLVGEIAVLSRILAGHRAIYLVSHKSLADQKYEDFQKKFGEKSENPIASVGLSTGDRDEGDYDAQLLVSTYEKALGLVVSGLINPKRALIVADELQILGEQKRGPDIESLCAILKQQNVEQFVALTATINNPNDLAGWLICDSVVSYTRDVELKQQIWYQGRGHQIVFGQTEGTELEAEHNYPTRVIDAVNFLLKSNHGPILVFTESRKEATGFANEYGRNCSRSADGLHIAEQLELFSEPTESSEQLRQNAEKNIAFHTADLTPQERAVIEKGFLDSRFEVCFATSTLAAGVNFPFKTVLFPKLTYQWRPEERHISVGDYRNMSADKAIKSNTQLVP
jgi:helicase